MKVTPPALLLSLTCAIPALAQTPPDYGLPWRTIGSPGNAPVNPADYPGLANWGPIGQVNYTFRLTQTEITSNQWLDFVDAYTRFHPDQANDLGLTGDNLYIASGGPGNFHWAVRSDANNAATNMLWGYAARYCNWLCNGKTMTASAFESGAYDTSTWWPDPRYPYTGQVQHTPGALFWIPSLDEWTKGMHFDPNKYGPGVAGYWLYPDSSDSPPIGGLPGTPGAQTGAGEYNGGGFRIYPVGSYPNAQSPWGLLDGSGGVREWLEGDQAPGIRLVRGSETQNTDPDPWDRLDQINGFPAELSSAGFRLASVVPSPSSVAVGVVGILGVTRRRRRPLI